MKELRNTGQCYTTKKGITKPARQVRELGICRKKCKELISFEEQQALFSQYWKLGTYELRQAFTAGLMDVVETKTVTKIKSDTNPRKRMHTYKYFLPLHGNRIAVCQNCFRKTLGESEQFLKTVARRKREHVGSLLTGEVNTQIPKNCHKREYKKLLISFENFQRTSPIILVETHQKGIYHPTYQLPRCIDSTAKETVPPYLYQNFVESSKL